MINLKIDSYLLRKAMKKDEMKKLFEKTRDSLHPNVEVFESLRVFTEMVAAFYEYLEEKIDLLERLEEKNKNAPEA